MAMLHSASEESGASPAASRSDLRPPPARRLRGPSWRDPRLLVGLLLIVASVVSVVLLVAAQDRTVPVYAADRGLSTGATLEADDLRIVNVQLDAASEHYISAEAGVPPDAQLSRPVGEGELLPSSALVAGDADGRQPVTVEVEHTLSGSVEAGRLVDVWTASGFSSAEAQGDVSLIAAAAEVADIWESQSTFGTSGGLTIELLVDPEELPGLLTAHGRGDSVTVLPADLRDH